MRPILLTAVLALSTAAALPARADERDNADIRCAVGFLNLAGSDQSKADTAAYVAAFFYGKLLTRNPGKDPASLVTDKSVPANQAELDADMERCWNEFSAAKVKINAINEAILARTKGMGTKAAPDGAKPAAPAP
jgi:hypothetical protein